MCSRVQGPFYGFVQRLSTTSAAKMAIGAAANSEPLKPFFSSLDNSFARELKEDPESSDGYPNRVTRPVKAGHFVRVAPTPLLKPYVVAVSNSMLQNLNIPTTNSVISSDEFVDLFSGNVEHFKDIKAWCTPYAVSVYGHPIMEPDQFRGYGYGDGRACSIGEVLGADGKRWEIQLKGSGQTPFSRQSDGRAVLRSSIREFLASEAMASLGVPTTRGVALVASKVETVPRAWYSEGANNQQYNFPPNHMIDEKCAIACRAAPSFIRVGHLELFSRRARRGDEAAQDHLRLLINHAIDREFSEINRGTDDFEERLLQLLLAFADRQARTAIEWIRVGYVQGNMNSDNCLLSGRTMDYGPFGFMENYHPLWNPFTSDPERKFGFERQVTAAQVNLGTLADTLSIFFSTKENLDRARKIVAEDYPKILANYRSEMRRKKLGLREWNESLDESLWKPIYEVLVGVDYTIFFRQLSNSNLDPKIMREADNQDILRPVLPAIYDVDSIPDEKKFAIASWIRKWLLELDRQESNREGSMIERESLMKNANPKYIPREWMLKEAYDAAESGNLALVHNLQELFASPYDEHVKFEREYYRLTPKKYRRKGGVSFYS